MSRAYQDARTDAIIAETHQLLARTEELATQSAVVIAYADRMQQQLHSLYQQFNTIQRLRQSLQLGER
ncbi:MAG: hypothetical protein M3R61_10450 [Chloroflexota bacterium]|nr:hypothetical protein [Chloroflexota bacterium]